LIDIAILAALFSCKQFLSEHFAENRMSRWRTAAKLWCVNFLCFFFWNTLY